MGRPRLDSRPRGGARWLRHAEGQTIFARRSGEAWFLAIVNGPAASAVKVPLSFLGQGEYRALLVGDSDEDAAAVRTQTTTPQRGDALAIALGRGGGFIARFARE